MDLRRLQSGKFLEFIAFAFIGEEISMWCRLRLIHDDLCNNNKHEKVS